MDSKQLIVFINTKAFTKKLQGILEGEGYKVSILTGDCEKLDRDRVMQGFRDKEINVILTTNLLARGIDILNMSVIVNYDVPVVKDRDGFTYADHESYIHRIGRTGRFDTKGVALSLISTDEGSTDEHVIQEIAKYYSAEIIIVKDIKTLGDICDEHLNIDDELEAW